jgi:Fe2+ or Zn2+ uptake regulation protein
MSFSAAQYLKKRGLRATQPRVELTESLYRAKGPVSPRSLIEETGLTHTTVYRTLEALVEEGAARTVDLRKNVRYYELAASDDHHHLVCVRCNRIEAFTGCQAAALAKKALQRSKHFSAVIGHSFELFGYCRSCAPTT